VTECKSKTNKDDCWSLSHCEWINLPKKFRDKVECGNKGQQINHELLIGQKADLTLKECNKYCFRTLSHIPCTQFLWDGDQTSSSSKGNCMAYEVGCTFDKASTSYNAFFTSNYEEATVEPEVCTHKMPVI